VYVIEADDAAADEKDRDKRKVGIGLGVSNGIINFVFDVRRIKLIFFGKSLLFLYVTSQISLMKDKLIINLNVQLRLCLKYKLSSKLLFLLLMHYYFKNLYA